jgi:uncharacterized protein
MTVQSEPGLPRPGGCRLLNQPLLGEGLVRHRRLRPTQHAFEYGTYFLMLPMRSLAAGPAPQARAAARPHTAAALARNRFGLLSFYDTDHGDGRASALAWLDELLAREGVHDAQGEVWLHTYPRVAGYVFKPVSFWYCHRVDNSLVAVVVEVNNTFGERHCYLLSGPQLAYGREQRARKVFHVSPFCSVQGSYRFRFMRTPERTVARVDHDNDEGPLLQTSISGRLQPLTARAARRAFFGTPLMTLVVVLRIHWHALLLWCKRVPFFSKPEPPQAFTTR